jgi:hypothetical protein
MVGGSSSPWTWNPANEDAGTYAICCKVTDSQDHSGEVTWEGFVISSSPDAASSIPTLSERGIIIFMTIIMGMGVGILVRRRMM